MVQHKRQWSGSVWRFGLLEQWLFKPRAPGPGWVDFDPSSGTVGNQNLVRGAVVNDPREAIPLQGSWFGRSADQIAMKVAVRVAAAVA